MAAKRGKKGNFGSKGASPNTKGAPNGSTKLQIASASNSKGDALGGRLGSSRRGGK